MSEIERLERRYQEAVGVWKDANAEARSAQQKMILASDELTAAKAAAVSAHEWEGKIVTRQDTKRVGSGYFSKRVPVTLRGVVETYRTQNLRGTELSSYSTEIGEPIVRILTAKGLPGKKLQKLKSPRIDGAPIWTLEEGQ